MADEFSIAGGLINGICGAITAGYQADIQDIGYDLQAFSQNLKLEMIDKLAKAKEKEEEVKAETGIIANQTELVQAEMRDEYPMGDPLEREDAVA